MAGKKEIEIYNNNGVLKNPTGSFADLYTYYNDGKISKHTFERIKKKYYSQVFEFEGMFLCDTS